MSTSFVSNKEEGSFGEIDLPPSRFDDSPPVRMSEQFTELYDIEDEAPPDDDEYHNYSVASDQPYEFSQSKEEESVSKVYSSINVTREEAEPVPVVNPIRIPEPTDEEMKQQQDKLEKAKALYDQLKLDLKALPNQQVQKKPTVTNPAKKSLPAKAPAKAPAKTNTSAKALGNTRGKAPANTSTKALGNTAAKAPAKSSVKAPTKGGTKAPPKAESQPAGFFQVEQAAKATMSANPGAVDEFADDIQEASVKNASVQEASMKKASVQRRPRRDLEELEKMKQIEQELRRKQQQMNQPPPIEAKAKVIPKKPVAPQPRNLAPDLYKLHQLADNLPHSNTQVKLTAGELSGSLLQAIKTMSVKLSEQFTAQEIDRELAACKKALTSLGTANDCGRGDKNYFDSTRDCVLEYQRLLNEQLDLVRVNKREAGDVERLKRQVSEVEPTKAVIKQSDGKYMRAGMLPELGSFSSIEKQTEASEDLLKEHPLDVVVQKFERAGLDLPHIFKKLDSDGDEVLTLTEIKQGLPHLSVSLSAEDQQLIIDCLDSNSDGVVSLTEFTTILNPKLQLQKEYRVIVGDLEINNPIVFEEELLDMRLKGRLYKEEMKTLMRQLGPAQPASRKLIQRITYLEKVLAATQGSRPHDTDDIGALKAKADAVRARQAEVLAKAADLESANTAAVSQMKAEVSDKTREQEAANAELVKKQVKLGAEQEKTAFLTNYKTKLQNENKLIAVIMIQARVRAYLQRTRYRKAHGLTAA